MALSTQPENINPLTEVQFKFELQALPKTTFFVQTVNLPGITMSGMPYGLPQREGLMLPGGSVEYEQLIVGFLVDEYLKNWQEVFTWITGKPEYTDGVLTILSSSMNPTLEIHFANMFPTNLSEIQFDTTVMETTNLITNITFAYSEYTVKNLLNN